MREEKIPQGYKQTEIGTIPEDWEISELQNAVDFLDGLRRPVKSGDRAKISGIYPYYGASGIVDYVNDFIFDDELILLGEDGENILSRNLPLAFKVSGKIWVNNHAHVMKPKNDFDIGYLNDFLESLDYSLLNSGTAQPKLNKQNCLKSKVAKPSLKEQTLIATALSDVDTLISELEKLIAKKQAIKTATMQQLLTGKTRLPQFSLREDGTKKGYKQSELGKIPEDWEIDKIGNVVSITTGDKNTQDKVTDGLYPFFVRSQQVEKINSFSFDGEAVLTAGDGVGTGKIFHYINGKFDFHQRVYLMHNFFEKLDGYYFYIFFSNHFYERIMSMTAKSSVDSVRREMIADMPIILPTKQEQTAIAKILSDMDSEIQALEKRLVKTRQIKQGMMQELLTGKTRLLQGTVNT
ncbi:restriction endonuclease subunit S [Acinetobacter ursingii]|uniref:restriction endonuclease subunit S n=1 Tax=Acinetobacter ursingii TaxID=108980 RepID=UPI001250420F|nr:restriction endonuclease subunit S [Acinetobacter ursingii]